MKDYTMDTDRIVSGYEVLIEYEEFYTIKKNLKRFIKESNKIEGIKKYNIPIQLNAYEDFIKKKKISIDDILGTAKILHESSQDVDSDTPKLRDQKGMNAVVVSNKVVTHRAPPGGLNIRVALMGLLIASRLKDADPFEVHMMYETLHPLTDCNGRTGRLLWAWMMNKQHKGKYSFSIGFLQKWYYQSLSYSRNEI